MSNSGVCPECKIRQVSPGHYVCAVCEAAAGIAAAGYSPAGDPPTPVEERAHFHKPRSLPVLVRALIVTVLVALSLLIVFEAFLIVAGIRTPPFLEGVKNGIMNMSQHADEVKRRLYDAIR
jgi:hypothetical protein